MGGGSDRFCTCCRESERLGFNFSQDMGSERPRHRRAQQQARKPTAEPRQKPLRDAAALSAGSWPSPKFRKRTEAAHSSDLYSRWAGSSAAHVKPETAACASELTGSGLPLKLSSGWTLWTLVISLLGPPCPGCAPACTALLPGTSRPPDPRHCSGSGTGGGQRGRRGH